MTQKSGDENVFEPAKSLACFSQTGAFPSSNEPKSDRITVLD